LVTAKGGVLDVVVPAGLTLWFRQVLHEHIAIDYDLQAVSAGRRSTPSATPTASGWRTIHSTRVRPAAGSRDGRFETYDTLETYYVGLGGNTTPRRASAAMSPVLTNDARWIDGEAPA
jgi:hypothetical protein